MYEIVFKKFLTPNICLMEIDAPLVAASAKPGQFVIVRAREMGERIPLTVCDFDRARGTVTIVIQIIGASSRIICSLNQGEALTDFVGPLGRPSDFMEEDPASLKGRRYLFVAGGLGTAPVYPQAKYLHEHGAHVDVIVGAKTESLIIMEEQMSEVCDNLHICTDDGSKGHHGLVTEKIKLLLESGAAYDQAVAIGPMIMMKFVALTLKPTSIPLTVSLNTLMVDGTGMCGACRVTVGGKVRFACVEGPEFDGYEVDFDEAMRRQGQYKSEEAEANEHHVCKIGRGK